MDGDELIRALAQEVVYELSKYEEEDHDILASYIEPVIRRHYAVRAEGAVTEQVDDVPQVEEIKPCPYVNGFTSDNIGVNFMLKRYDRYSDFILFNDYGNPIRCFRFTEPPKQESSKAAMGHVPAVCPHDNQPDDCTICNPKGIAYDTIPHEAKDGAACPSVVVSQKPGGLSHDLYHALSWLYEVAKVSDTNYAAVTHAAATMKKYEESPATVDMKGLEERIVQEADILARCYKSPSSKSAVRKMIRVIRTAFKGAGV